MQHKSADRIIADLRAEIDGIDAELVELIERRLDAACRIGTAKRQAGMAVQDRSRELQVRENCRESCKNPQYADYAEKVMMCIMDCCRGIQFEQGQDK